MLGSCQHYWIPMEAAPPGFVSAACVWMIAPRHYRYVLPRLHVPKPSVARPLLVPAAMRFDISLASWRFNGRAAEAGVFALAALGQLPSGAEALHFSVRVEAAEDRSCSFETHWGPGTKPYTCALPTPSRYTVMCQWPWWRSSVLTSVSWTTTASTRIA